MDLAIYNSNPNFTRHLVSESDGTAKVIRSNFAHPVDTGQREFKEFVGVQKHSRAFEKSALISVMLICQEYRSAIANTQTEASLHFHFSAASTIEKLNYRQGAYQVIQKVDLRLNCADTTPQLENTADAELETIFNGLARIWRESTGGLASVSRRLTHPTYRAILRLGPETVPLILKELQRKPDWWFDALEQLTKANPVPTKLTDTFEQAVKAWINWGKTKNLIR